MPRNKFTLLELMIVIAIIGILVTILIPSLNKSRYYARAALCAANLKSNVTAINLSAANNNMHMPSKPGGTPEFHRYFFKKKNDQHILLGELWKNDYLSSPQSIFCPEVKVNFDGSAYTYSNYMVNGEFNPRQGCVDEGITAARSNYITYPYVVGDWSSLFISQLDNEGMLQADAIFNKHAGEKFYNHQLNGVARWSIMRVDGSMKFVKSSEAQTFTTVYDLYNNWPDTEIARDILLGNF
jgi:prepilin-type N-terminal cleavage/methylation domain-containing protein